VNSEGYMLASVYSSSFSAEIEHRVVLILWPWGKQDRRIKVDAVLLMPKKTEGSPRQAREKALIGKGCPIIFYRQWTHPPYFC